ncbi:MAG: cell division ATP-binding protein FtsE [Clostridia bacterium]|nr:cell division ATP-binding protein FtsE [Clostridia bacterium]MDD4375212.1 cell division ATP-binding protein FtsE [Clostridia bacterium]
MIEFQKVTKRYDHDVYALKEVDIKIEKGEFIFLVGPSGSGKSTFLKLIIKEEDPTNGKITINSKELSKLKEKDVPYLRRKIGFVFQDFRLLYDKTVEENIVFALRVIEASEREIRTQVSSALKQVGLEGKEKSYPNQLSGGEQQRVSLARAIATRPPIIIADEPTGNLDNVTAKEIMESLFEINRNGTTVVVVTHDENLIKSSNKRVITLNKGRVASDTGKGGLI